MGNIDKPPPSAQTAAYEFDVKIDEIFDIFQSSKKMDCRYTKRCYIPQWGTFVQGWIYLWRSGRVVIRVKHYRNSSTHDALPQPSPCTVRATLIHGDIKGDKVFEKKNFEPHLQAKIGVKLAEFYLIPDLVERGFVVDDAVEIRFSLVPGCLRGKSCNVRHYVVPGIDEFPVAKRDSSDSLLSRDSLTSRDSVSSQDSVRSRDRCGTMY